MSQRIELAEFVEQLRSELGRAFVEGKDQAIKFECGPIDLEVEIVVERAADAGARIRFWVIDADVSANLGTRKKQRIRMTLTPRTADAPFRQLRISGEPVPNER